MRHISLFLLLTTLCCLGTAQDDTLDKDVNSLFELTVDTIERRVIHNNWGNSEDHILHYRVKNMSDSTLTFITNTCFYYNHSFLTVAELDLEFNISGGCLFNSHNTYQLLLGATFSEDLWIVTPDLSKLKTGEFHATLSVPMVEVNPFTFRIDGRSFVENASFLNYTGSVIVVRTDIDKRSKRKRRREPLALQE